ncbi:MAG: hypothetical protein ACE5HP_11480 [Gemmatimonadota bacterium]
MTNGIGGVLIAAGIGTLAGLHAASWGMYKDAPHEGFRWSTYARSPLVAGLAAPIALPFTGLDLGRASGIFVFFGFIYIVERALVEFYKTFLRDEDQSKYFIPMQFHLGGRLIPRRARWIVGIAYVGVVLLVLAGVWRLERAELGLSGYASVVLMGTVGGWISAIGGAWKDGPIEGFSIFKFFRSPLVALFWALVVGHFTHSYLLLLGAATGYTVATIETYKTFFFPNTPRGKFAGMPVRFPDMLRHRQRVVPLYAGIWAGALVTLVLAFAASHDGLIALL